MKTQQMERIVVGDGLVQLRGPCFVTGNTHTSPPVTEEGLKRYESGGLAQDCFPELSSDEREFLISGTSPEGCAKLFPPEEERHDPPLVIFDYSRAQAIADGLLIDVTETAKEAGFTVPVSLTAAVWASYVKVPEGVQGQNEEGRLWDILWMLVFAIKCSKSDGSELLFKLAVRNDNSDREPPPVILKAVCGPGDDAEPVMTVMLVEED